MVVHQGDVHKYLGMTIDYTTKRVTCILMVEYVKGIVVAWDKASKGIKLDGFKIKYRKLSGQYTAAPLNLFTVDEAATKLPKNQKATFHNVVAKALYVAKWARPNIAIAIAFLHPNMRGHSRGALTLGLSFPILSSGKQKLNTRTSTESELVGVAISCL
jgi:hypothetical protein